MSWRNMRLGENAQKLLFDRVLDGTIDKDLDNAAAARAWEAAVLATMRKRPAFFGVLAEREDPGPNKKMIDADADHKKYAEWLGKKKQREYCKAVEGLRETQQVAEELWDGEHLSNAIEKTVTGANHPQAMWGW